MKQFEKKLKLWEEEKNDLREFDIIKQGTTNTKYNN